MFKKLKNLTIIIISFLLVVTSIYMPGGKDTIDTPISTTFDYVNTEWIIKWKDNIYHTEVLKQAEILDWLPELRVTRVKVKSNVPFRDWIKKWGNHPSIEYIQPNYATKIAQFPNDAYNLRQDYLQQINAEVGWSIVNSSNITIAILDTGVDASHPDLKLNMIEGINLLDREKPALDDNGHGTNVAGIVAAVGNNIIGITGLTWKTKIMPIKVLDENGDGNSFFIGQGIRYAVDNGAKIIILSLGESILAPFMKESVDYAAQNGVLIVAASGNDGDRINYPAALPNVLSVGAVDALDSDVYYSNFGQQLDVVAPGNDIYTTKNGGDYVYNSGTSMAAPQVAGLAALIMQKYPTLTPYEVSNLIKFTSDDVGAVGWDVKTGYGRINMGRALSAPLSILEDWYEPNQTYKSSSIFPIGDVFKGQIIDRDIDWYKMILPYDGNLTIDLSLEETIEHGVEVKIYHGDSIPSESVRDSLNSLSQLMKPNNLFEDKKKPKTDNNEQDNQNKQSEQEEKDKQKEPSETEQAKPITYVIKKDQRITINVPKGEVYLKVTFVNEQLKSSVKRVKYSLTNNLTIHKDQYEPNEKPWNAFHLTNLKEKIYGTFNKENDSDWYKVMVNQDGTLSVTVRVDSFRLDPVLILQPLDRLGSTFDYNVEEFGYLRVSPGEYYIKVSDYNSYAVLGEYNLQVNFKSDDGDANEPNDQSTDAAPLDLSNKLVRGNILNQIDQDWFSFELKNRAYLNMDFGSDYSMEITLYNEGLEVITQNIGVNWANSKIYDEGLYYLRISSPHQLNQYSFQVLKYDMYGDFIDIASHWARDMIVTVHEEGLIDGYNDYTFRPDNQITRGKVAEILFNALELPVAGSNVKLVDISEDHKQYAAITSVYNAGLMGIYEDYTFKPSNPVSREELVSILAKAYRIPIIYDHEQRLSDVTMENSYFFEINTFKEYGLLLEFVENEAFKPKSAVTRGEFVGLFARAREFVPLIEDLQDDEQQTTD